MTSIRRFEIPDIPDDVIKLRSYDSDTGAPRIWTRITDRDSVYWDYWTDGDAKLTDFRLIVEHGGVEEVREPRVFLPICVDSEGVKAVRGASGTVYRYIGNTVVPAWFTASNRPAALLFATEGGVVFSLYDLMAVDAPVTELFDDDPALVQQ